MRHGCRSLVNFEIVEQPPAQRSSNNPWPQWPRVFRVDYGHEEAAAKFGEDPREFCVQTVEFVDDGHGHVKAVKTIDVDWQTMTEGGPPFVPIPGTEREYPADLVFLALGFLGPEHPVADQLGVKIREARGGMSWYEGEHEKYRTSNEKVFVAGDCRRGKAWLSGPSTKDAEQLAKLTDSSWVLPTCPDPGGTLQAGSRLSRPAANRL